MSKNRICHRLKLPIAYGVSLLTGLLLLTSTRTSLAKVMEITSDKNVDERLFLTYVLNDLYGALPTDYSNPQQVTQTLDNLQWRTNRYHAYLQKVSLDSELTSSFADLLQAIDAYTKFLQNIGNIQQSAGDHLADARLDTATRAGEVGGGAAANAYYNGASGGDAALAGLAYGAVAWIIQDQMKQHAIDETKRAALEQAGQELKSQLSTLLARLDITETNMTSRYKWGQFEVRSSDSPDDTAAWQERFNADDIGGLLRLADRKISVRPRDPMLFAVREQVASCDPATTPAKMKSLAEHCVSELVLIPAGRLYDDYRAEILWTAIGIADAAFAKELRGVAQGTAHSQIAAYTVHLCDTLLSLAPNDSTGEYREERAWALMACGRVSDAVAQAKDIADLRGNTLRGALNMARLMNAAGDMDASFKWFEHAVKDLHYNDIAYACKDPDLAAMRAAKNDSFKSLLTVNWAWSVSFGFFHDDVVLTNNSPFPITNIVLSCKLSNSNGTWTPVLNVDAIQPGQAFTWKKCMSITGSQVDSASATLSCDQNR